MQLRVNGAGVSFCIVRNNGYPAKRIGLGDVLEGDDMYSFRIDTEWFCNAGEF